MSSIKQLGVGVGGLLLFIIVWSNILLLPIQSCHAFLLSSCHTTRSSHFTTNIRVYLKKQNPKNEDQSVTDVSDDDENNDDKENGTISRRDALLYTVGGTAYFKLASSVWAKLQRGEDVYPPAHESRAADTFSVAMSNSASALIQNQQQQQSQSLGRPLRLLEVGIGTKCRTFIRGMYDDAILNVIDLKTEQQQNNSDIIQGIEFVGVDIDIPKEDSMILQNARDHILMLENKINKKKTSLDFPLSLDVRKGDIAQGLPFPNGYFDVITTSLVLCSVEDQKKTLDEIKRLLNPSGGTFGYIEHVAVDLNDEEAGGEDLAFLELQQQILDPLQQFVAHNCHLHRNTDLMIRNVFFGSEDISNRNAIAKLLQRERFQVKDMWPVSCQCRGVVQLIHGLQI